MSSKKVISINPDFFSMSGGKQKKSGNNGKTSKNKTMKKQNIMKQKLKQMSLKPSKMKKDLLRRIKEHQKQQGSGSISKNDSSEKPKGSLSFSGALSSLENIVAQQKKDAKKKQMQQRKPLVNTSSAVPKPPVINAESITNIGAPTGVHSNGTHPDPRSTIMTPVNVSHAHISTLPKMSLKPDPPYGCLKGGKKKTYRQYYGKHHNKTLKRGISSVHSEKQAKEVVPLVISHKNGESDLDQREKNSNESNIDITNNDIIKSEPIVLERQKKLDDYRKKLVQRRRLNKGVSYKKKYKVHRYRKTYKLGKQGGNINVLIKNNKTQKKIKRAIQTIEQTPLIEVKKYLKERQMLKTGSSAPEYVLRSIYKDAMLSGDIKNVSDDVLMHNYFTDQS